jgi:hypothetical protein|tara:strand:+ start:1588 stop:1995 length:408 start_codon:yes stop_codon:yes gene_type:complete
MTEDYSNIWSSVDPYSAGSASGTKIINGRVRVHAFWVVNGGSNTAGDNGHTLSRPMSLRVGSGGTELYKVAFPNPSREAQSVAQCFVPYQHNFGGNGILFTDGVWFSVDANDQTGSTTVGPSSFVAVLYTGGANT